VQTCYDENGSHIVPIDKLDSKKVARVDASEGRSGHHRPTITMEERFRILMEEGDQMGAVLEETKIQKVIFLLRDHKHFVKYFEPIMTSLGPIHHGNPKY
jgi:hypothetical protein